MKIAMYLDKCKEKLNISSTYALAKAMNVDERKLHEHYKGKGSSEFVYFKIAQILELDPAFVIADIKAETEKDEVRKEFFKSFAGTAKATVLSVLLVISLSIPVNSIFNALGAFSVYRLGSYNGRLCLMRFRRVAV